MKRFKYGEYLSHVLPSLYYGILCGVVTGALIYIFKFCAKKAEEFSVYLYGISKESPLYVAIAFAVLAGCAYVMYLLHKKIPECRGGGIPRSEGVLRGVLSFRWFKTLIGTFFGSLISFVCGLPLGSEGPAVLMGTSVGKMCVPKQSTWSRYIMTGGAGAGFAVATGAPLSGILFALEEIHKRFTPMLVLSVSASVLSATYVNRLLCQLTETDPNLLHVDSVGEFQLSHIGYLLLLGVIIAFAVGVFDASIGFFGKITARFHGKFTGLVKLIAVFALGGILVLTFKDAAYNGHHLISEVINEYRPWMFLAAVFVIRLIMMLLITDSGVTGGIFIPTLAIGVSVSALAAKFLCYLGLPIELYSLVTILGMCAFIGGTLRAPLTAAVLFLELTLQFTNMLYVAVVIFAVAFITEMLNLHPFYDIALEKMVHIQNKGKTPSIACFKMNICEGAFVVGKAVRDIMWPHSSVVLSITRADENATDMDNDGEKKLYSGDTIIIRAKYFDEENLKNTLKTLVGKDSVIEQTEI